MRRPVLLSGLLVAVLGLGAGGPSMAQQVALGGVSGSRALLIVDGGAPRFVAVGQSHQGVKLLRLDGEMATVEIDGRRQTLRVGEAPVSLGGGATPQGSGRVVMILTVAPKPPLGFDARAVLYTSKALTPSEDKFSSL